MMSDLAATWLGERGRLSFARCFVAIYCIAIVGYHLYAAQFGTPEVMYFRPAHVSMYVSLILLIYRARSAGISEEVPVIPWYDWILAALAWLPALYITFDHERIVLRYPYVTGLEPMDWIVGILAIVLTVEACRRTVGLTLVMLFGFFVFHALFGQLFPGSLGQTPIKPEKLIDHLFMTTSGLYGSITGISATYVLMFVLLGAVLEKARGGDLFMNLSVATMGRQSGGPGKAAVVASGLFGSISGAAVANVYATGTFTIPLMIRTGFKKEFAAAVEAVASASGQLVPPIMGSAAFLIADFTGTPYSGVAWAAALPAFLYLFAVFMMVQIEAMRDKLPSVPDDLVRQARRDLWKDMHMMAVLVIVVVMLMQKRTPFFAAYVGVLASIGISMLRAHSRMSLSTILGAFELGARRIAPIAAALFVAGMIVGTIELTGLGLRFTSILVHLTQGNLVATLILVMISCIVLGMGLPTAAAYMIVAIFGAPALVQLGVQPLAAHMFVFYFAILSAITPPVAMAAYAAATIAGTPMQKTGMVAMKLGAAVYIVPFVLIYSPALLMIGPWWQIVQAFVTGTIGVIALAAAVQGYFLLKLTWPERGAVIAAALCLLSGGLATDIAGIVIVVFFLAVQILRQRRERAALAELPASAAGE